MTLKEKYNALQKEYIEAFMRKHGFIEDNGDYFDYNIGGQQGEHVNISDYFLSYDDIRMDIDKEVVKDVFFDYYNHCIENESNVNYNSYLMGAR